MDGRVAGGDGAGVCSVGLTGGLASGKSAVARLLERRGARVLDADRVVHDLYRPEQPGAAAVVRLFGRGLLDRHGGVDRRLLAERIAGDAPARRRLEEEVHPLVRDRVGQWMCGLPGGTIAVVEAALLVETGAFRRYDVLVVVWCERGQQLERARRRGTEPDLAARLIAAQTDLAEKCRLADVVVDNSGSEADLGPEVDRAWRLLLEACRGPA